jgi:hypothetical protein
VNLTDLRRLYAEEGEAAAIELHKAPTLDLRTRRLAARFRISLPCGSSDRADDSISIRAEGVRARPPSSIPLRNCSRSNVFQSTPIWSPTRFASSGMVRRGSPMSRPA